MLEFPGLTTIHLIWDGPKLITEAFSDTADSDFGLYALYGTHSVYGPDTLLYVGQSNLNTFGPRLRRHYEIWARWEPSDVKVYLGRVAGWNPVSDEKWGILIDHAEALTIYFTSPAYNSHRIKELKLTQPITQFNHGRRHRIPLCISNIPELVDMKDPTFAVYGRGGQRPEPSAEAKEDEELLDRLSAFRGRLPADFEFDRDDANAR
jgi:hypothetical protein